MVIEPTLEKHGWTLENAVERHNAAPDQFHIPSAQERTSLEVGSRVKLLFLLLGEQEDGEAIVQCERMWVTVEEVREDHYVGVLYNVPATSEALHPGDLIIFTSDHVAGIGIPWNLAVLTTRSIIEGGQPILFISHDEDDGGWQFLDGGEPREEDAMIVSLHNILRRDQSLAPLADLPIGWVAWREAPSDPWRRELHS